MLGWSILKEGHYRLSLPILSKAEEELIVAIEEQFKDATRARRVENEKESEDLLRRLIFSYAEEHGIYLDEDQADYLTRIATLNIYGLGPLEELLADRRIEEISVIGLNKPIYVYLREHGWKTVNCAFTEERAVIDTVNKMASAIGRRITLQNPRIDAMLKDGSRLHASLPPISDCEITIRKFREQPFSPPELIVNSTIPSEAMALLSLLMGGDNSIIIAGNTASGKTTTLNALFSFIPCKERVVITEETPEINIPHPHQIRLVANKEMGLSLSDLVYDTLRMRPDRMIVGEVRNKMEVEALFDVLLAGQARGAYATFHAQSADEAIARFRSYGIAQNDMRSVDSIVVQKRMLAYNPRNRTCSEIRKVTEIGGPDGIYYRYGKNGGFNKKMRSVLIERAADGLHISHKELKQELAAREKLLKRIHGGFHQAFSKIQKAFYNEHC